MMDQGTSHTSLLGRAPRDRREELLFSAVELFLRYGYKKTTLDDLAEAANISKSTLYHYFSNKDDLFRQATTTLVDYEFSSLADRVASVEGLLPKLGEYIAVHRDHLDRFRPHLRVILGERFDFLKLVQDQVEELIAKKLELLENILIQSRDSGELTDCPTREIAVVLHLFIHGSLEYSTFTRLHAEVAEHPMDYILPILQPYIRG